MSALTTMPEPKKRPIPKRVRDAIDEIVQGRAKNITAAAKKVGLSREYLSRTLGEPQVADHLRQKAARAVAVSAGRAAARINQLIDASSEHVSFDASKHVLAIAGIKPAADASLSLSVDIKAGFVIDLSEPGTPARPGEIITAGSVTPKIVDAAPADEPQPAEE